MLAKDLWTKSMKRNAKWHFSCKVQVSQGLPSLHNHSFYKSCNFAEKNSSFNEKSNYFHKIKFFFNFSNFEALFTFHWFTSKIRYHYPTVDFMKFIISHFFWFSFQYQYEVYQYPKIIIKLIKKCLDWTKFAKHPKSTKSRNFILWPSQN